MRVHATDSMSADPSAVGREGPLRGLGGVLGSVDSVRNLRALYLLLLTFALAGLMLAGTQQALGEGQAWPAAGWAGAAFFIVFYGTSAAGLVVMDEALGLPPRPPAQALRDALGLAHRLLVVVVLVLVGAVLLLLPVLALLAGARLPGIGGVFAGAAIVLGVPLLGLTGLVLLALVGPIAAPAVWSGHRAGETLAMIGRHVRHRFAHAVVLSAAVSLLTAAVAGLVSFVIVFGARAVLGLAAGVFSLDLTPQAVMAALFGTGLRLAPGAPALSAASSAAITGANMVFALGLVVPGVVYLRGLCELFLALRRLDDTAAALAWTAPPP